MLRKCITIAFLFSCGCAATPYKDLQLGTAAVASTTAGNLTIIRGEISGQAAERVESIYFNVKDKKSRLNMLDILSMNSKVCQLSPSLLKEKNMTPIAVINHLKDPKAGITCKLNSSDTVATDIELSWVN